MIWLIIYLVGVLLILSFLIFAFIKKQGYISLMDIIKISATSLLSWLAIVFILLAVIGEVADEIKIYDKNKEEK